MLRIIHSENKVSIMKCPLKFLQPLASKRIPAFFYGLTTPWPARKRRSQPAYQPNRVVLRFMLVGSIAQL